MFWAGSGIVGATQVKIQPDFKVQTVVALQWIMLADGNMAAVDRGSSADIYETEFVVAGRLPAVQAVVNLIESNRTYLASNQLITLSRVLDTEHIFGEDVNHAGLTMTVLDVSEISQRSWQVYGVTIRARAVSPSFLGTPSLPAFRNIHVGRVSENVMTINKMDTYYGTYAYLDHSCDSGQAKLSVAFSLSDIQALRGQLITTRGGVYNITTSGAWDLFGPTRAWTSPTACRIIAWEDAGWFGLTHRVMTFTLAEVV